MVSFSLKANILYKIRANGTSAITMIENPVKCGSPAAVQDMLQKTVDLNEILIRNKATTYLFIAEGESMGEANIPSGALLVIDRSIAPRTGHIVLADIDGEYTLKRLDFKLMQLMPENPLFEPIIITDGMELKIWGVLTKIIIDPYLPYVRRC
jgi:DNA polymerase V